MIAGRFFVSANQILKIYNTVLQYNNHKNELSCLSQEKNHFRCTNTCYQSLEYLLYTNKLSHKSNLKVVGRWLNHGIFLKNNPL